MIRLALRVRRQDAELVLAELIELAPSGVEEVDIDAEVVEYAVYGPPGELPELPDLRAAAGGAFVEVTTTEIADDWNERWREFHQPLLLGDRLVVRPPWVPASPALRVSPGGERSRVENSPIDIVIDPGQAFGTGAHATTRLCLELLLELEPDGAVVDLGCGSGVLAITAARLGWEPVLALDYDPLGVTATAENARANGVSLDVRRFDLRSEAVPAAPLVLANLLAPLLLAWCSQLAEAAGRPGLVIAGGLLRTEADRLASAFSEVGLLELERRSSGEWSSMLLQNADHG